MGFRRSDDPSNQNVYKTTADTAKFAASGYCFSRGSTRIYPCSAHGITDATSANAIRGGSSAHADAGTATLAAGATDYSTTGPAHPYQFVDNLGPFKVSSYASATAIKYDVTQMDGISKFYTASDYAKVTLNIYQVIDDADDLPAGSILLMNGRRYKTAAAQTLALAKVASPSPRLSLAPPTSSSAAAAPTAWPTAGPTPTPAVRSRPTATSAAASTSRGASSSCSALPPSSTLSCPWSWTRSPSSTTVPPPPRSASVPPLVPSAPRLPPSPPTATLPSTRCTTPPAISPSLSPSPPPTPTTSTSPSAPTVALATAPPASAAASRATPTTTATPRTCSPPKVSPMSGSDAGTRQRATHVAKYFIYLVQLTLQKQ